MEAMAGVCGSVAYCLEYHLKDYWRRPVAKTLNTTLYVMVIEQSEVQPFRNHLGGLVKVP